MYKIYKYSKMYKNLKEFSESFRKPPLRSGCVFVFIIEIFKSYITLVNFVNYKSCSNRKFFI